MLGKPTIGEVQYSPKIMHVQELLFASASRQLQVKNIKQKNQQKEGDEFIELKQVLKEDAWDPENVVVQHYNFTPL